ncbi:MAG: trehalose-6-phosphate synthase [bacterium]
MKITLRLILSLVVTVIIVAAVFSFMQVRQEKRSATDELEHRSRIIAESLQESAEPYFAQGKVQELRRLAQKITGRERVSGITIFNEDIKAIVVTPSLNWKNSGAAEIASTVMRTSGAASAPADIAGKKHFVYGVPLQASGGKKGALLLFIPADHIGSRLSVIWRNNFLRAFVQIVLISLITLTVVKWSITGPVAQLADWMKQVRTQGTAAGDMPGADIFAPILREASRFARSLTVAKAAAEEEARLREEVASLWTAERLKQHISTKLGDNPLFVVSNREPYMHIRKGNKMEITVPASGMVTAIEPVLRAAGGTWIAHGAGSGDRETVDRHDRIRVPPDEPGYTLRRVWLTKEEENGYYYGFSNEGLWPLCHIAHARPLFRAEDWRQYEAVNLKFAGVVAEETRAVENPCILIQDYHFALLPKMIKQLRPDARIAIFWHIPWPNPEAFGICPWQKELLDGMLGADILGFHIQYHCNNFLDTVDRVLESRIDWEHFSISRLDHTTMIKPFQIGIAPPLETRNAGLDKASLLRELGVKAELMGVGVDRIDYTKGIIERFQAIEKLLEKYPEYREKFTFVEIGAPSRTLIKRYHDLISEVTEECDRINWKFQTREWRPIVLIPRHHSHAEIEPYYRAADLCLVTSLHDGMNLVAKEFVAARSDSGGVLILSRFTGASRELQDALIVNPYDAEQTAEALRFALEMPEEEKRERMERLRKTVRENNVYRWAGRLIGELADIRINSGTEVPV